MSGLFSNETENGRRWNGRAQWAASIYGIYNQISFFLGPIQMQTIFSVPLDLARSVLAQPHTVGSGTLILVDASSFGNPAPLTPVRVTAIRQADKVRSDYIATGRSGNTLTVTPGDGYADIDLAANDIVGSYVTAATIAELQAAILSCEAALLMMNASFNVDGSWNPPHLADSAAAPNSVYFSTTASPNGMVYKDAAGSIHLL